MTLVLSGVETKGDKDSLAVALEVLAMEIASLPPSEFQQEKIYLSNGLVEVTHD